MYFNKVSFKGAGATCKDKQRQETLAVTRIVHGISVISQLASCDEILSMDNKEHINPNPTGGAKQSPLLYFAL